MNALPLLVSANDVILRMQLDGSLAGITDVVNDAIQAAQVKVHSVLGYSLLQRAHDSLFFTDGTSFSDVTPNGLLRLELRAGFLRTDSTLTVTIGTDWTMATNYPVQANLMKVDYERGYILLDARTYRNKYVRVQGTTGFNPSVPNPAFTSAPGTTYDPAATYNVGDTLNLGGQVWYANTQVTGVLPSADASQWTAVTYGPEKIPMEIREAILNIVPSVFDSSQITNRDPDAAANYKQRLNYGMNLLYPFIRNEGFSYRAI